METTGNIENNKNFFEVSCSVNHDQSQKDKTMSKVFLSFENLQVAWLIQTQEPGSD